MASPTFDRRSSNDDHPCHLRQNDDVEGVPYATELGFLTVDYISELMRYDAQKRLMLDMSGQYDLFARYPQDRPPPPRTGRAASGASPAAAIRPTLRRAFVERMVLCILHHPLATEIRHLNMSNMGCGNDFVREFCRQTVHHADLLPNVEVFNVETNHLSDAGLMAVVDVLLTAGDGPVWQELKELRVNNNKHHSIKVEKAFCDALVRRKNGADSVGDRSGGGVSTVGARNKIFVLTKLNLEFRNPHYREVVHTILFQNLDSARQSRLNKPLDVAMGNDDTTETPTPMYDQENEVSVLSYLTCCCRCDRSSPSSSPSSSSTLPLLSWMSPPSQKSIQKAS